MIRRCLMLSVCIAISLMVYRVVAASGQSQKGAFGTSNAAIDSPPTAESCNGLDVVFLIDQSYSMKFNDTNKNRAEAIRYAIARIGENVIYFCPDAQHRIAVIGFWDEPGGAEDTKLYIQPTTIAPDPDQFSEWEDLRKSLADDVTAALLGSTDFISAFQRAAPILKAWREKPVGDLSRKQAVIVIADGGPCVVDEGCSTDPEKNTFARGQYLKRLEKYTSPDSENFPWIDEEHGTYIWLISFNDAQNTAYDYLKDEALMASWQRITRGHGGDVLALRKSEESRLVNTDLAPKLTEILDNVLGSELIQNECGEPIWVPAYIDSLVLHVFKIGSDPDINIEDVTINVRHERRDGSVDVFRSGKAVEGAGSIREHTVNGPNERYVFASPDPGAWYVTAEGANICKDVDVRYKPVDLSYRVVAPGANQSLAQISESPYYDTEAPAHFRYRVTEKLAPDRPIRLISGYPLSITVSIQRPKDSPAGTMQECTLERQDDGDYRCEDPLLLPVDGTYTWQVIARAPSVDPNKEWDDVFTDTGSFKVRRVDRFGFKISSPTEGEETALNRVAGGQSLPEPVAVSVQLLDVEDQVLEAAGIVADLAQPLFTATIIGPDGDVLEEKALEYNQQRKAFQAEMRTTEAVGSTPDVAGDYLISVKLADNYRSTDYMPRYRTREVSFSRHPVTPVDYALVSTGESGSVIHQPLYQGNPTCIGAEVVPVELAVALFDPADPSTPLDPARLAKGDPGQLFTATLINPEDQEEPLELSVQSGREGVRLIAAGGTDNPLPGDYLVRIIPNAATLQGRYQFLREEALETSVVRQDSFLSRPSTCRTAGSAAGGIMVILLGVLVWGFVTRPLGVVTFKDRKTGLVLHEEMLGNPLRGWWHWYRSKHPALKELQLSKMEATRASPPEGELRAINLVLYDEHGGELLREEELPSGEEFDLDTEVIVRYE